MNHVSSGTHCVPGTLQGKSSSSRGKAQKWKNREGRTPVSGGESAPRSIKKPKKTSKSKRTKCVKKPPLVHSEAYSSRDPSMEATLAEDLAEDKDTECSQKSNESGSEDEEKCLLVPSDPSAIGKKPRAKAETSATNEQDSNAHEHKQENSMTKAMSQETEKIGNQKEHDEERQVAHPKGGIQAVVDSVHRKEDKLKNKSTSRKIDSDNNKKNTKNKKKKKNKTETNEGGEEHHLVVEEKDSGTSKHKGSSKKSSKKSSRRKSRALERSHVESKNHGEKPRSRQVSVEKDAPEHAASKTAKSQSVSGSDDSLRYEGDHLQKKSKGGTKEKREEKEKKEEEGEKGRKQNLWKKESPSNINSSKESELCHRHEEKKASSKISDKLPKGQRPEPKNLTKRSEGTKPRKTKGTSTTTTTKEPKEHEKEGQQHKDKHEQQEKDKAKEETKQKEKKSQKQQAHSSSPSSQRKPKHPNIIISPHLQVGDKDGSSAHEAKQHGGHVSPNEWAEELLGELQLDAEGKAASDVGSAVQSRTDSSGGASGGAAEDVHHAEEWLSDEEDEFTCTRETRERAARAKAFIENFYTLVFSAVASEPDSAEAHHKVANPYNPVATKRAQQRNQEEKKKRKQTANERNSAMKSRRVGFGSSVSSGAFTSSAELLKHRVNSNKLLPQSAGRPQSAGYAPSQLRHAAGKSGLIGAAGGGAAGGTRGTVTTSSAGVIMTPSGLSSVSSSVGSSGLGAPTVVERCAESSPGETTAASSPPGSPSVSKKKKKKKHNNSGNGGSNHFVVDAIDSTGDRADSKGSPIALVDKKETKEKERQSKDKGGSDRGTTGSGKKDKKKKKKRKKQAKAGRIGHEGSGKSLVAGSDASAGDGPGDTNTHGSTCATAGASAASCSSDSGNIKWESNGSSKHEERKIHANSEAEAGDGQGGTSSSASSPAAGVAEEDKQRKLGVKKRTERSRSAPTSGSDDTTTGAGGAGTVPPKSPQKTSSPSWAIHAHAEAQGGGASTTPKGQERTAAPEDRAQGGGFYSLVPTTPKAQSRVIGSPIGGAEGPPASAVANGSGGEVVYHHHQQHRSSVALDGGDVAKEHRSCSLPETHTATDVHGPLVLSAGTGQDLYSAQQQRAVTQAGAPVVPTGKKHPTGHYHLRMRPKGAIGAAANAAASAPKATIGAAADTLSAAAGAIPRVTRLPTGSTFRRFGLMGPQTSSSKKFHTSSSEEGSETPIADDVLRELIHHVNTEDTAAVAMTEGYGDPTSSASRGKGESPGPHGRNYGPPRGGAVSAVSAESLEHLVKAHAESGKAGSDPVAGVTFDQVRNFVNRIEARLFSQARKYAELQARHDEMRASFLRMRHNFEEERREWELLLAKINTFKEQADINLDRAANATTENSVLLERSQEKMKLLQEKVIEVHREQNLKQSSSSQLWTYMYIFLFAIVIVLWVRKKFRGE